MARLYLQRDPAAGLPGRYDYFDGPSCHTPLAGVGVMAGDFGQHVFATLLRQAAEIDRISGISRDQELTHALSAIRRQIDAALDILGERVEAPPKSARQRVRERMFPWDAS